MKTKLKIGFIGCGNMGEAILSRLLQKKIFRRRQIGVSTLHAATKKRVCKKYGVQLFDTNRLLVESSPLILIAVKPQQMDEVLGAIPAASWEKVRLVMTIAAGLNTAYYSRCLPKKIPLIRLMPNTPLKVGTAVTGLFVTPTVGKNARKLALKIFSSSGTPFLVAHESLLDGITALAASGTAFVLSFIRALTQAGIGLGFPPAVSSDLVTKTIAGTVDLFLAESKRNKKDPLHFLQTLISQVTSKGGTTEAGLKVFKEGRFDELVRRGVERAAQRAKELRR